MSTEIQPESFRSRCKSTDLSAATIDFFSKPSKYLAEFFAVPLYALTRNQQFRRGALNLTNFALTLQRTLWTVPYISSFTPSLLCKFITSLVLGFTVEGHTITSTRKNVSDIDVKKTDNVL
jgi:hypothetical protein